MFGAIAAPVAAKTEAAASFLTINQRRELAGLGAPEPEPITLILTESDRDRLIDAIRGIST
jgi:hypothetical protein